MPNTTADVLIIGAGSSGSAISYYLADKGVKNIIVLDKLGPGSGATGHAAGLIRHHYMDRDLVRMVRYCSQKFASFEEEMGYSIDYVPNEFIYLAGEKAPDKNALTMQQEEGVRVELLGPDEIRHIHPLGEINTEGVGYGLLDHDASYADPYKVAVGYSARAKELGVDFRIGTTVTGITLKNGKVSEVLTNKGTFEADTVINAAGLGAAAILKEVGCPVPLRNFSLGHIILIPDIDFPSNTITINDATDPGQLFFCRPESGNTCLLGMDKDDPNRVFDPATYYFDCPFDKMSVYYAHVMHRLPFIKNFRLSSAFGGLDVKTPDWNPGLGYLKNGPENLYNVVGGSGHAFKLAPAIGRSVAEELLGEDQSLDMSVFDINRLEQFTENDFGGSFFINE